MINILRKLRSHLLEGCYSKNTATACRTYEEKLGKILLQTIRSLLIKSETLISIFEKKTEYFLYALVVKRK